MTSFDELKEERLMEAHVACAFGDVDKAIKHFYRWILLFNSADSPYAFLDFFGEDYSEDNNPDIFWKALHESWSMFDAIPHDAFRALFPGFNFEVQLPVIC
jgi:hypothetical protein